MATENNPLSQEIRAKADRKVMEQEARALMESLLSWDKCSSRTPANPLEVTTKECLRAALLDRRLRYVTHSLSALASHQVNGGAVVNMAVFELRK